MKRNLNKIILVLFLFGVTTFYVYSLNIQNDNNLNEDEILRTSATYTTPIDIDDIPGSLNNWSWAKSQGYCTGSGTENNPYIIQNHLFNTSGNLASCLTISHSRKHFEIRNCRFIGYNDAGGIRLYNTTNGRIIRNENIYTGAFLWMLNSSYNYIAENDASNGYVYGIFLETAYCGFNEIIKNDVINNTEGGIVLSNIGENNIIDENNIETSERGIFLDTNTKNNTITNNIIRNHTIVGLDASLSQGNDIYSNCFINNTLHAIDNGAFNRWDNGEKGNYWDNYTGSDADGNGIGDTPYFISGTANAQDNYPLMKCPLTPRISGYNLILIGVTSFLITALTIYISIKKKK